MTEDINKSLALRVYNYRMRNGMTQGQFGKIVGITQTAVHRVEHGVDCLSDRSKAKIEAVVGAVKAEKAAPDAPCVPFDVQKGVTPNSLEQTPPEKRLTRENLLQVAWFLEGYGARDNSDALHRTIALLHAMAQELTKEEGA